MSATLKTTAIAAFCFSLLVSTDALQAAKRKSGFSSRSSRSKSSSRHKSSSRSSYSSKKSTSRSSNRYSNSHSNFHRTPKNYSNQRNTVASPKYRTPSRYAAPVSKTTNRYARIQPVQRAKETNQNNKAKETQKQAKESYERNIRNPSPVQQIDRTPVTDALDGAQETTKRTIDNGQKLLPKEIDEFTSDAVDYAEVRIIDGPAWWHRTFTKGLDIWMGNALQKSKEELEENSKQAAEQTQNQTEEAIEAVEEVIEETNEAIEEAAEEAAEAIEEQAEDLKDNLEDAAEDTSEAVTDFIGSFTGN